MKQKNHDLTPIVIDGIVRRYAPIKKQYRGYLGEHNCPQFPANTYVMQSLHKVVHFHYCLN